jgi:HEPN domain-containing protein
MSGTTNEWLAFAKEDLRVAEILQKEEIYNQVCFHCQQCIEKCLKSILVFEKKVPPRTHSITDLLRLLPKTWATTLPDKLIQLDVLYTPTRYPDTLPGMLPDGLPGKEKAEETLIWARDVLAKTEQYVQS